MKKSSVLYFAGISILLFGLPSCKKYLEKKSNTALVVPVTLSDFQGLLDDKAIMNYPITPSFGESAADDYFLLKDDYDALSEGEQHFYKWIYDDYNFQNDWSINYIPVYNANLCLEGIKKIPVTSINELQWNNIKGSALFYRAYCFLNLSWIFSKAYDETSFNNDLGIVLRVGSDFNIPSVRSSVRECYERVIADVKQSIQYLPDVPLHVIRPSKAAAYGLLARAYLSMRKYDSAFRYSNLCLQIKSQLMDYNSDPEIPNLNSFNPFKSFNKEILFYTEMNGSVSLDFPGQGNVDTLLYASYDSNDLRKSAFFTSSNGPYFQFKGNYAAKTFPFFTGIATDEMYLIRAECYARAGNRDSALADLNALMIKRWKTASWVPFTAIDANEALNKILLERRKELVMRCLRWSDIKRLNKENFNIILKRIVSSQVFSLSPNNNKYAIPLPKDVINQTGMPQNPQ